MNKQGNTYTIIYSIVLVILVAVLLSVVAMWLQPRQNENMENEKRQNILSSVKIPSTREESKTIFDRYIVDQFVVNSKGEKIDGENAFKVDLAKQAQRPSVERLLPVFVASIDNQIKYILPVYGKGLWGPLWGYISLNDDKNTIYGAIFDHKGETPGLGAEIATPAFQDQFTNKTIFDNGEMIGIYVKKGKGNTNIHDVDAISGGTITSQGVEKMLKTYLTCYESFLKK